MSGGDEVRERDGIESATEDAVPADAGRHDGSDVVTAAESSEGFVAHAVEEGADVEPLSAEDASTEATAAEADPTDGIEAPTDWKPVIEALLFATAEPLTPIGLRRLLHGSTGDAVRTALQELKDEYDAAGRGVTLMEVAGGWMVVTRDTCAPWVEKMLKGKRRVRLSRAALETVAVVAYKQPISRMEIERIRGVDCGGVLATLVERDMVMIKGRDPGPGKPLLYGTTQDFLNYFGLNRLSELPRLDELSTLAARNPAWTETERLRFEKAGLEDMPEEIPAFDGEGEPARFASAGDTAGSIDETESGAEETGVANFEAAADEAPRRAESDGEEPRDDEASPESFAPA